MEARHEYEVDLRNSDWDDSKMIAAYDKSVKLREKAIAKAKKQGKNQSVKAKSNVEDKLCVGMHCRALYPGDGCYYEAKVRKVEKNWVTVEFLGYGDLEEVDPMTLKETLGKKARKKQMKMAEDENSVMSLTCCESPDVPSVSESCTNKKKLQESQVTNHMPTYDYPAAENANTYQVPHQAAAPYYAPPQVPHNVPSQSMGPPPAPPVPQCSGIASNSTLSSMLMSWYMAGYYTGLHQSKKEEPSSQRCCGHSNQCCHH